MIPMAPAMIPVPSDLNTNPVSRMPTTAIATAIATHLPAM